MKGSGKSLKSRGTSIEEASVSITGASDTRSRRLPRWLARTSFRRGGASFALNPDTSFTFQGSSS
jgi:hypothetical protein